MVGHDPPACVNLMEGGRVPPTLGSYALDHFTVPLCDRNWNTVSGVQVTWIARIEAVQ